MFSRELNEKLSFTFCFTNFPSSACRLYPFIILNSESELSSGDYVQVQSFDRTCDQGSLSLAHTREVKFLKKG